MVNRTVLDNGVSIISEKIRHVRSVSIGVWVRCGSCCENPNTNGTAHFIEHMMFKGTKKRSAFDIAWAVDSVGGVMNAFTAKELTSFYLKIPDYHLPLAIDLLADILMNSSFDDCEIIKERSVIRQEIHMLEDSPDELIHDLFDALIWNEHPLGLPVLGNVNIVEGMSRKALSQFFNKRYNGRNLIITAAGNLEHNSLVELISGAFGSVPAGNAFESVAAPITCRRVAAVKKDIEQVHLVLGVPAPAAISPQRHACILLNSLLGGSMSSRLFQEIREKRGLAYDIQSYLVSYISAGLLGVYVAMDPGSTNEVVQLILDAFGFFAGHELEDREINAAKEMFRGNLLLSMESTDNRMTRLARNELYFKRDIHVDEIISKIDAVTGEEIRALAQELFSLSNISIAAIGRITDKALGRALH